MRREKGFTLVELAIVLVIIGIILGAILKGQELIFNAKVKRVQSQIKEVLAAFYTYYDRYGYYPGDDPTADDRWSIGAGDGDGIVEGGTCSAATEESCLLWQHLRYANIISGDRNDTNPASMTPKHVFGGPINVYYATHAGQTGHWIRLENLDATAAQSVDQAMDDGKCDTGSVVRVGGTACSGSDYPNTGTIDLAVRF